MIDKTVVGGRYLGTDNRFHDAEGRMLEEETKKDSSSIPDNFPAKSALVAAGYVTLEGVISADDETLLAIDGIGKTTLAKIRAYEVTE